MRGHNCSGLVVTLCTHRRPTRLCNIGQPKGEPEDEQDHEHCKELGLQQAVCLVVSCRLWSAGICEPALYIVLAMPKLKRG